MMPLPLALWENQFNPKLPMSKSREKIIPPGLSCTCSIGLGGRFLDTDV